MAASRQIPIFWSRPFRLTPHFVIKVPAGTGGLETGGPLNGIPPNHILGLIQAMERG